MFRILKSVSLPGFLCTLIVPFQLAQRVNKYIAQERSKTPNYVRSLRGNMQRKHELDYQATPDELTQLKYNVKHTNKPNNKGVAGAMHRDKDWVRCMREKLREADNV